MFWRETTVILLIIRMLGVNKGGHPRVPYQQNSNQRRVQRVASGNLLKIAGSPEDLRCLLSDLSRAKEDNDELLTKLITNIHQLFAILPARSRVRPAMLAVLTKELTISEASRVTGYSNSSISYARRTDYNALDVLSQVTVNVSFFNNNNLLTH